MQTDKRLIALAVAALIAVSSLVAYVISNGTSTNINDVAPTLTALAEIAVSPTVELTATPTPAVTATLTPTTVLTPAVSVTPTQLPTLTPVPNSQCATLGTCYVMARNYRVLVAVLNVRNGPATTYAKVGTVKEGDVIWMQCLLQRGDYTEVWMSAEPCSTAEKWMAMTLTGVIYQWLIYDN